MQVIYSISTTSEGMVDIEDNISTTVKESKIQDGVCVINVLDEKASVIIALKNKKSIQNDIINELERMVAPRVNFNSEEDPVHTAATVKSSLVKSSLDLIIQDGALVLAENQSIFLTDYVGERTLNYIVTCI